MPKSYHTELAELVKGLPPFVMQFLNAKNETLEIRTRVAYAVDIKNFFTYLADDPNKVTIEMLDNLTNIDIDAYLSYLSEYEIDGVTYKNSAAGKKRKLASLKSLFKYLRKVGLMKNNPTEFTEIPKVKTKEIIVLSEEEQDKMCQSAYTGHGKTQRALKIHEHIKYRDMAILTLFLGTGLRVSELVGIDDADLDLQNNRVYVHRKGGNEEYVYFGEEVKAALIDYIETERPTLLLIPQNTDLNTGLPLFASLKHTRISVNMVEIIVKNYAHTVLPMGVKITPHTLRKTFGTALYAKYKDLYLTQKALGHQSPQTTEKYYAKFNPDYLKKLKDFNPSDV